MPKTSKEKTELRALRAAYLDALEADPEHLPRKAAAAVGMSVLKLTRLRKDRAFVAKEVAIVERSPIANASSMHVKAIQERMVQEAYLSALAENLGAEMASCQAAGVVKTEIDRMLRDDEDFRRAREDVYEALRERLTTESMKVALGENPQTKDSPHLRWMMGKLMPDKFGEKPKQVEHHYSGKMTVEHIDAELAMLLGDDDVEQLERP